MSAPVEREAKIKVLREFPVRLEAMLKGLEGSQLDTPCGEGEWTVRQVAHHLADSHMNSFIRLKLMLTEAEPTLKPYNQEAWAQLPDTATLPPEASLLILKGLHQRWVTLFENLSEAEWQRSGYHPEIGQITPVDLLDIYVEHCREHTEQINRVIQGES
jgi:hypothetical protein